MKKIHWNRIDDFLAHALDTQYKIPFTAIRFGWDAIIGLIPGAGDTLMAFISFYFIFRAVHNNVPFKIILAMIANIVIEWLLGSIPVVGDIFDIYFKSNIRNLQLLRKYSAQ
ncbi:MAG: DUF4112 domain-containing protein [Bdellovibrionales bacterium]|nr:DUF4112 domain-containing protein [Bdellovibrionales bacterium]